MTVFIQDFFKVVCYYYWCYLRVLKEKLVVLLKKETRVIEVWKAHVVHQVTTYYN